LDNFYTTNLTVEYVHVVECLFSDHNWVHVHV